MRWLARAWGGEAKSQWGASQAPFLVRETHPTKGNKLFRRRLGNQSRVAARAAAPPTATGGGLRARQCWCSGARSACAARTGWKACATGRIFRNSPLWAFGLPVTYEKFKMSLPPTLNFELFRTGCQGRAAWRRPLGPGLAGKSRSRSIPKAPSMSTSRLTTSSRL